MSLEGKVIVFEGTDGVGKSTQANMLSARLRRTDHDVLQISTPSALYRQDPHVIIYNTTGESLLSPTVLSVMSAADRLRTYETEIKPHIDGGGVVVCDRYKFSAEAYFKMRGADMPTLRAIHQHLPDPDYAVLLTIDAVARSARLLRRATTNDWEEQDMSYLDNIQDSMKSSWKAQFKIVDASQEVGDIAEEIAEYVGA